MFIFLALLVLANNITFTNEPLADIGPARVEKAYTAEDLSERSPAEAPVIKEYGFERLVYRKYEGQGDVANVEIYQMKDSKAAFGLYTYFKTPQAKLIRVGDGGYTSGDEMDFWQDRFFVRIKNKSASSLTDKIARALSEKIKDHNKKPLLISYLPEKGLSKSSVKYFLGPQGLDQYYKVAEPGVFGFKDEVEAVVADYTLNGSKGKLMLLGYPDHPLAISYFKNLVPTLKEAERKDQTVYIKRAGVIVAALIGDFKPSTANRILREVTYADSVKWIYDKQNSLVKQPTSSDTFVILGTVVNSFLFTGLFFMLSAGLGAIMGGVIFKTRHFGRSDKDPIIRLRI